MKKNKIINQKDIKKVLKYAIDDLPRLENKFRSLANTVLDLEIKKKELSAQLLDLRHVMNQYPSAIDMKRKRLANMEICISRLAHQNQKKPARQDSSINTLRA